ncbi:hypothetical protein Tco_0612602 [Tanacetum coccineum]
MDVLQHQLPLSSFVNVRCHELSAHKIVLDFGIRPKIFYSKFLVNRVKLALRKNLKKTDNDLAQCVEVAAKNDNVVDIYVSHSVFDFCDATSSSRQHVDNVEQNDASDSDLDNDYNIYEDIIGDSSQSMILLVKWKLMRPVLGEKYEILEQLNRAIAFYALVMVTCSTMTYEYGTLITSNWIARNFAKKIMMNPCIKVKEITDAILKKYKCKVGISQARRGKMKALEQYETCLEDHYGKGFMNSCKTGSYKSLMDRILKVGRSEAYFTTDKACDVVENGISECFNALIVDDRRKPIINMLKTSGYVKKLEKCKMITVVRQAIEVRNGYDGFRLKKKLGNCTVGVAFIWYSSVHGVGMCMASGGLMVTARGGSVLLGMVRLLTQDCIIEAATQSEIAISHITTVESQKEQEAPMARTTVQGN